MRPRPRARLPASLAELARQTLPGAVGASVTLIESDQAYTAAFTGPLARDLDETQYHHGYGPCLEVAQSAGTVTVPDMAAETRWPGFARRALDAGIRCSLSVALPCNKPSSAPSTSTPPSPPPSTPTPSS